MYRRLVTLSRMLHNGAGHGTPFVLSTPLARPLARPLACPSMALWDAGRSRAMHGRRRRAAKQWAEGILPTRCPSRRPGEAADFLHQICLSWPAVAGVKRPIVRQQAAQARRVEAARGATGRRASHGRKRWAAKQWAEGILPTRCPPRRPREEAD
eukprot:scaffold71620_cov72-Phaeocystis_antarctica.AAC.4